jgi:hypothetical protein
VVKIDACHLVVTGVYSQYDDNDILHPVAYCLRNQSPSEINYETYDKELLVIVWAYRECCLILEGSPHTIEVVSDHQNLTYFTTNPLLYYCQTQ